MITLYVIIVHRVLMLAVPKRCKTMSTDAVDPKPAEELTGDLNPTEPAPEEQDPKELDRYECRSCGYTYEPAKGDGQSIEPGTPFTELPLTWRCPVCGSKASAFANVGPVGNPSGFKENLGYGLGVNTLTPGQKNILIYGAMALAILFFLSLYGLK